MLNKNIFVDHCYNVDQNHRFLKKLEKLGFTLDKSIMEHPGKAFCRFIMFKGENSTNRFYPEFVTIGRDGLHFTNPGLSFGHETNLEKFYQKINKKFSATFSHKNYEWKKNNKDQLPGWNFIKFEKPIIKKINTWFTEYEVGRRKKLYIPKHKNAVQSLHGLVLSLSKKSQRNLEELIGAKINNHIKLKDGNTLYIKQVKQTALNQLF